MDNVTISLVSALGMIIVAIVAVCSWRRLSGLQFRWFWAGAGLWAVAVILKVVCALATNKAVLGFMKESLSYPLLVLGGGLFVGVQSSMFEMGMTYVSVLVWRQLGRDANRAIGIGVGAGVFEALLLGIASLVAILACLAGLPGTEEVGKGIAKVAGTTLLFWLLAPVERVIAIVCHASSRALVLLGTTHRKPVMVFWRFVIFTLLDGVAGAAHVSGKLGQISMWWIELAVLPFALLSLPILRWCYTRWGERGDDAIASEVSAQQEAGADGEDAAAQP